MRDQTTKKPIYPSPLVATGIECISCQDLADKAEYLAEELGGEEKRLPPWVRVVMEPRRPEPLDE